jgi:ribonuclease III
MDECEGAALREFLCDTDLAVSEKIRRFIQYYNRARGTDADSWQVSKEEWERYEFLGDRVLNLVASELLYSQSPPCREGIMSPKMGVVSNESLAAIAERRGIDINPLVPVAIGQQQAYRNNIRGGAIEACIGAIYISAGFEATRMFVQDILAGEIERFDPSKNFVGRLQEHFQQMGQEIPEYHELSRTGPDHQPMFTYSVSDAEGRLLGTGTGSSIAEAWQMAAKQALEHLTPP